MSRTDLGNAPRRAGSGRASRIDWRRGDRSITALRDRRPLGAVRWESAGTTEGLDLAIDLQPGSDPEVACVLLDRALSELGGRGVPTVRLTLTAGEPQTPGMLQIVRRQRPTAVSADVVADAEVHAAGPSALVDVRLRPRTGPRAHTDEGAVS